jgi:hypothetical protein
VALLGRHPEDFQGRLADFQGHPQDFPDPLADFQGYPQDFLDHLADFRDRPPDFQDHHRVSGRDSRLASADSLPRQTRSPFSHGKIAARRSPRTLALLNRVPNSTGKSY